MSDTLSCQTINVDVLLDAGCYHSLLAIRYFESGTPQGSCANKDIKVLYEHPCRTGSHGGIDGFRISGVRYIPTCQDYY